MGSNYKKFSKNDKERFLTDLRNGATVKRAATNSAHPYSAWYDLRSRDEEFAREWELARMEGTDAIEEEVQRRAIEGVNEPVIGKVAPGIDGQLTDAEGNPMWVKRYSDKLAERLLTGRRPEYRDNPRIDILNQTVVLTQEDRSAGLSELVDALKEAGVGADQILGGRVAGEVISDPKLLLAESEDV